MTTIQLPKAGDEHRRAQNPEQLAPEAPTGPPGELKLTPQQVRRLGVVSEKYANHFIKSWTGKASPRQAIKAQCLDCAGMDRQAITTCTATACPLWRFRPYVPRCKTADSITA